MSAVSCALSPASRAAPRQDRYFSEQVAVHAESYPTGLYVTPGGDYVFTGEGGTIAILDARTEPGMHLPLDVFPLSSRGLVPVAMTADPGADLEDGVVGPQDWIYVAAGRDGLWAFEAEPAQTAPRMAWRIDDSGNLDVSTQGGRRWRQDVDLLTIGGEEFLVTLGAKRNANFLRLFRLSQVHTVLANATETGNEIAPDVQFKLSGPPGLPAGVDAYGYGMAVDVAPPDHPTGADVYVALGMAGVARVRLVPGANPQGPPAGAIEYGPRFGTGSAAHVAAQGDPNLDELLYDDFHAYDLDPNGDDVWDDAQLEVQRPPLFMDVAVQREAGGAYRLLCAVDTCGWVSYDLTQPWTTSLMFEHQAGWVSVVGAGATAGQGGPSAEEHLIRLVASDDQIPNSNDIRTWPRRIAYVHTSDRPVLVVTSYPHPLETWPQLRNEGRVLDALGQGIGGMTGSREWMQSRYTYTQVFDLTEPLGSGPVMTMKLGGQELAVPGEQPANGDVVLFASGSREANDPELWGNPDPDPQQPTPVEGYVTFRAQWKWSLPDDPTLWKRQASDRSGRFVHMVADALGSANEVLLPGANDAGFGRDGSLVLCGTDVVSLDPGDPDLELFAGVTFNPRAQWPAGPNSPAGVDAYFLSLGRQNGAAKLRMQGYSFGSGVCGQSPTAPQTVKKIWITTPQDRFGVTPRQNFTGAGLDAAYDAYVQSLPGKENWEIAILTRLNTDWGALVVRREVLQAFLDSSSTVDGGQFDLSAQPTGFLGELITHPEIRNVDESRYPPGQESFPVINGLTRTTLTFYPRFFELPSGPNPDDPMHPVVAIPCGTVIVNGDEGFMSTWGVPPGFAGAKGRPLVRLFDISDPDLFEPAQADPEDPRDLSDPSPNLPAFSILGPKDPDTEYDNAWWIETAEFAGRTWLFVADYGGRLLVYDVTDLLYAHSTGVDTTLSDTLSGAQYFPPALTQEVLGDFSDAHRPNLYGLAVDVEQYTDGQGQQQEQLFVYMGVSRVGVEVHELVVGPGGGLTSSRVDLIQTPGEAEGLWIRRPAGSDPTLWVANTYGGIRAFGFRQ